MYKAVEGNSQRSKEAEMSDAPTPRRWHVKDEQGEDLLEYWRRQPPHSNEVAAAKIIDELERELATVREAALEEAARMCEESAKILREKGVYREADALSITAHSIRALKETAAPQDSNSARVEPVRVMFHDICDQCGKHSAEYTPWYICTDCLDTVCDTCAPDGDGETLRSHCKRCLAEEAKPNV